jgi:hypothetical protein
MHSRLDASELFAFHQRPRGAMVARSLPVPIELAEVAGSNPAGVVSSFFGLFSSHGTRLAVLLLQGCLLRPSQVKDRSHS